MGVDREFLEAIGQLMDAKLAANNQALREEMSAMMDAKLEPVNSRLDSMQADIAELKDGQRAANIDIAELKDGQRAANADIAELKEGQRATIQRLDRIEGDIVQIKEDAEITRDAANRLLAWAEEASVTVQVPLFGKR